MELCRDCGHRNVGAIYCAKCGSELFARKRTHKEHGSMVALGRLLTMLSKRN